VTNYNLRPASSPMMTRWAKFVSPEHVHHEYPRPQMVRKEWLTLNGLWDLSICPKEALRPEAFDRRILVPYPVESPLSGVMESVRETDSLWYRRTFQVPKKWDESHVLLNFGAVDWETSVYVNSKKVGDHLGGYDSFSLDITDALKENSSGKDRHELIVRVFDPTDRGYQPGGKQVLNQRRIWYTPTSGIWQTVWIEPVNVTHFSSFKCVPEVDSGTLSIYFPRSSSGNRVQILATIFDLGRKVSEATHDCSVEEQICTIVAKIPDAKLWSPDSPHLYDVKLVMISNGGVSDEVESYFGMRKISVGRGENGFNRILLNDKPLFQLGLLDQGFWPDGLYAAPTDEALRYDIEVTKRLGFNLIRKHVKVEPDRWYYWCDKLGMLVWQDMPSGDKIIDSDSLDIERSAESAKEFETELKAMIDCLYNHPCIVMWVAFNEGWGQWDTIRVAEWIKQYDPKRLVDSASGWFDRGAGDVNDVHIYPGPGSPKSDRDRALVLGEFGGLGLPIKGHVWQSEKNWGYRSFDDRDELTSAYIRLVEELGGLVQSSGLSAAVYTQTTDVEIEVNGLMTYDREVVKMNEELIAAANKKLVTT